MKRAVLLSIAVTCSFLAHANAADRKVTDSDDALAIYIEDNQLYSAVSRPADRHKLVMAIWADGHAVWSGDRINGGAPYYTADVDPKRYAITMKLLRSAGAFDKVDFETESVGPDAKSTVILVRNDGRQFKLNSWHEQFEQGETLVADDGFLRPLDKSETRWGVLQNGDASYLRFRLAWAETRLAISNLLPPTGRVISGELDYKNRDLIWRPLDETYSY